MKTVIITGANGNLGMAVTTHFLEKGFSVVATVRKEAELDAFKKHKRLAVHSLDLLDEKATTKFVKAIVKKNKKIDALFCIAGGFAAGDLAKVKANDIDTQVALNFKTAFHIVQPILQHVKKNGEGRIVVVGARPALEASQGKNMVAYALSKSLLFKLAEFINEDVKGTNIAAAVIVPSTIDTPDNREAMPKADFKKWVKPAKIAALLEYIVSEQADVVKETVIKVYGNA